MTTDSLIGRRLANFEVQRAIGHGGMAQVYYGRDVNLERPVAIKVIKAQFRADPAYAERFVSEARAVATWRHENIVAVYYAGQEENLYYFVMEYIEGMDLSSLLADYAAYNELMPHGDVIRILKAVAAALDYAHAQGVIHRDVKPGNVMISRDDRVVLADFGLALDVQKGSIGEVLGTPQYVSPEQARRSADAVPQSDVYSLGIMAYEMLTGAVPFDDPSPTAVALQHLSHPPPSPRSINPNLNKAVEAVLLRALEKEPEDRYATATALVDALETALNDTSRTIAGAELPPMPPGMEPTSRAVSGQTVAERVALGIHEGETQEMPAANVPPNTAPNIPDPTRKAPPAERTRQMQAVQQQEQRRGWLVLLPVAVVLIAVVGAFFLFNGGADDATAPTLAPSETAVPAVAVEPTAEPTTAPTDVPTNAPTTNAPTAEPTAEPPTDIPATTAPTAIPTQPPTDVPTAVPTELPTLAPPTDAVGAPPAAAEPTVAFPNGRPVTLMWNSDSFYWHNPTGESMRVSPIAFEAITADGNPTGSAFDGGRWTLGFRSVEPRRCVAIELFQTTDWLRPDECRNGYNSQINLAPTADEIFWTDRGNATHFIVRWDGAEAARCEIAARRCELRVP